MFNLLFDVIRRLTARLHDSERGEVSLEYVLVGGLAAVAIIAGMAVLSPAITGWFTAIAAAITNAMP